MIINNPYFSVELDPEQFSEIKRSLKKELKSLGIEEMDELNNSHISISYVLGKRTKEDLEKITEEIAEGSFSIKVNGINCLVSSFYKKTIISLNLNHSEDFLYSQEFIKEDVSFDKESLIKEDFKGGFQAHISLVLIKEISDEELFILSRYLETALLNLTQTVKGKTITVYNDQREKVIEKYFKN